MVMRRDFKNRDERDIKDQLNDWHRTEKFDIVLKCWNLNLTATKCKEHCGEHTVITRACIESHGFPMLMNECRDQASSLWASDRNTIRVMCISDQGRHRSVAVSSTLRSVNLKLGFNSLGPIHFCKGSWWGMCHTCKDCKPNAYKEGVTTALAHQLSG